MSKTKSTPPKEEAPTKSVFSSLGTEVLLFPLAIVVGALITRYLGPTNKGIYSFILLIYGVFLPLVIVGNNGSTQYYLSSKRYQVKDILGSTFLMIFYFSILANVAIYCLWYMEWLGETGTLITKAQIICILFTIPPVIANLFFLRLLMGTAQFVLHNKIVITFQFVQAGLLLFFAFGINNGLTGIIIAVLFAKYAYLIIQLRAILKHFPVQFTWNWEYVKKSHTYGAQLWIGEVVRTSNNRLDQLIIGFMLAPELLGFFSIGVVVAELIQKVPQSVMNVFFNQIAKSDERKRQELFTRIHKLVFWITLLGGIFIIIFGYWLIILMYGKAFEYSYTIMLYYIPGVIIYMSTRVLLTYFAGIGEPIKSARVHIVGFLVGIPAYTILIKTMGVIGIAIGSTLIYFATNIYALWLYQVKTGNVSLNLYRMNRGDWQWLSNKYQEVYTKLKTKIGR